MILRDYQTKAIDMIRDALRKGYKRILVCLPTGSGKSIIMGHIAKMCLDKGNKVLAIMHRRGLVNQLSDRFESCGVDSGTIMAGVDSELHQQVQIATVQTYSRRLNFEVYDWAKGEPFNPWEHPADVVLVDESHRSLSKTFQDILNRYEDKVVLGFTATPSLSSGVAMGIFYQALLQPVGVKELIACGALVHGVYYGLPAPDLKGLRLVAGDYEQKGLSERVSVPKLIGDIVLNWLRVAQGKKTIVFAVNVKHSKAIAFEFNRNEIRAEHLDAHSNGDERAEVLARFRSGETTVLCNCDLFAEGTDIPELECVCLARPTKSIGRYLQMIGRGARPYQGKQNFLVLDHGKNVNEHGFYEDPIVWDLDGKKISYTKPAPREPKEKHKMTCRACSAVFTGSICPQCLTEVKDYGKKIEAIEYELKALSETRQLKNVRNYPPRVLTAMLVSEANRLGKTDKWIRANYKNITDRWPKSVVVSPIPATDELKRHLQYLRIKWIKSHK